MKQTTVSKPLKEAEKAIEKIKKIIPKLSEGEKATLELLLDKESQGHITKSIEDARRGNVISWEDIKKDL